MFFQGPHAVNKGPLEERFGNDPAKLFWTRPRSMNPDALRGRRRGA